MVHIKKIFKKNFFFKCYFSSFKNLFPPPLLHYRRKQCKLIMESLENMKRYKKKIKRIVIPSPNDNHR